jgi:Asp-tRNA(Asn)/Glu-tRNA(Gln) amidotransferase A subunit family amidase
LGAPSEPQLNGRSTVWTFLGQQGFPAITVPAGFTTQVYDRVRDPNGTVTAGGGDGDSQSQPTRLMGPIAAKLPVGIDFLGRPFDEPKLLKIAAAYEAATKHRIPPPDFGPVAGEP